MPLDSSSLAAHEAVDPATLWQYLRRLVERVRGVLEGDGAVDDCLDILVELLGADRGLVLIEQGDGVPLVLHARGPRKALTPSEQEEASRTIVRQALESDSFVVWEAAQPLESPSVAALGIHAALVAPLPALRVPSESRPSRGVLYVDFRHPRKHVAPAHQEFFMAAVVLIGAMLDQSAAARILKDRLEEARSYRTEVSSTPSLDDLLRPRGMAGLRDDVALALAGRSPVLVLGESGSGKTLLAQALAEASGRKPIVRVVLGASDDLNTIASELFGHERGAFSGAVQKRVGLVEYANGGTLILDEVLNLPLHGQKLLLDFTQFGTYRPLGYDKSQPKRADVRLIAVTNGDLDTAIAEQRFREDLYYRLAGITLSVPPLRERPTDVPILAETALRGVDSSRGWTLSLEARTWLASGAHEWPGNVRELEWVIRRARDRAAVRDPKAREVRLRDLGNVVAPRAKTAPRVRPAPEEPGEALADAWKGLQELREQVESRESEILRKALEKHGGVVAHAAKELGIARTTLAGRAEALGAALKPR